MIDKKSLSQLSILAAYLCFVPTGATAQPNVSQQGPSQFTLACQMRGEDGSIRDENFFIDESDRTKSITQTTIQWTRAGGNKQFYNIYINRITGYIRIGTREFPNLLIGKCIKAENRMF
jgi:hypothetical protein